MTSKCRIQLYLQFAVENVPRCFMPIQQRLLFDDDSERVLYINPEFDTAANSKEMLLIISSVESRVLHLSPLCCCRYRSI
jgi:hypothetical protein